MTRTEIETIMDEYTDIDTPIEEEKTVIDTFEIIPFSQSHETDYHVDDEPFYGELPGLCMGWQFEARNVDDERFPVGKILYFSVIHEEAMPEVTAKLHFMQEKADERGWELTGRVVFRGYGRLYWYAEERDWCVADVTPEEIEQLRREVE